MNDINISLVQTELVWEDHEANRRHIADLLSRHLPQTDIILLPEMFATGFSMNAAKLAETMQGESIVWMQQQARKYDALVVGSLIIEDAGKFYNRLCAVHANGKIDFYNKRHLFRMAHEETYYTAGTEKIIVEHKGWRILPLVCYDLRFPVWSRNALPDGALAYDILLYVANWPEVRGHHWRRMLPARAIENLSYVAAVNRVGVDGKSITYRGDSVVLDPNGEVLTEMVRGEGIVTATLSAENLKQHREKFAFYKDADNFTFN